HLQGGHDQGEYDDRGDRVPVRPEAVEVLAQVRAPLATTRVGRLGRRRTVGRLRRLAGARRAGVRRVVEPPTLVVLDKCAVALARGAGAFQGFGPVTHD